MEGEAGNFQAVRHEKLKSVKRTSLMVILSAINPLFFDSRKRVNLILIY